MGVLLDIHLEFLKHSPFRLAWVYLLGRGRKPSLPDKILADLARAAMLVPSA
jgi:hypothetical protein